MPEIGQNRKSRTTILMSVKPPKVEVSLSRFDVLPFGRDLSPLYGASFRWELAIGWRVGWKNGEPIGHL